MPVSIGSPAEFQSILSSTTIVVADFYADWCGPCKAIAPLYETLSKTHTSSKRVAFTKINVDSQQAIAQKYGVTAMPTFLIFRSGSIINTLRGADPRALKSAVESAVALAGAAAKPSYSTPGRTLGGPSGRQAQSLNRPMGALVGGWINAIIAFLGLYLTSLFAIDPYKAAEASSFNVNRVPAPPTASGAKGSARTSAPVRRVGTLADLGGS